jgi:hypothetical protein
MDDNLIDAMQEGTLQGEPEELLNTTSDHDGSGNKVGNDETQGPM